MILKYLEPGQQFYHHPTGNIHRVVQLYSQDVLVEDRDGVRRRVENAAFFAHPSDYELIVEKKCA